MKLSLILIIVTASFFLIILSFLLFIIISNNMSYKKVKFKEIKSRFKNFDEIFKEPQKITIETYVTGKGMVRKSGLINIKTEYVNDISEKMEIKSLSHLVRHEVFGDFLIDAGLDKQYQKNPYGSMKGLLIKKFLGKFNQEQNKNIASILQEKNIKIKGIFYTHLHFDHTAGTLDLSNDTLHFSGIGEKYQNYQFLLYGNHLNKIGIMKVFDFNKSMELPPFEKAVDIFGDGSLWAIWTPGHTKGHISYLINGEKEQVLVTGDACLIKSSIKEKIGPGNFSEDIDKAQKSFDRILKFATKYPFVRLIYGHEDL